MPDKSDPTTPLSASSITSWDIETDVAIIGYGGAGSCAAIEAADAGAAVIIFEASSASGGSTALSSAEIYMGGSGGTRVQKACGYEDSTEDMVKFMTMCAGPQADEAKIRAYCEGSAAHFDWIVDRGVPFKDSEFKERAIMAMTDDCLLYTGNEKAWPFSEHARPCPRGHNLEVEGDNGGPLFMGIMAQNVQDRDIRVEFDSRALTLITDDSGDVVGVVVRIDQQEKTVRARRGVVLCAGGFVMNQEMLKRYAPSLLQGNAPIGNPGDTGAGILMAMGAGAAAINMHEGFISMPFYPPASLTRGIFINDNGQRYINEDCYHGRIGHRTLQQPGKRIYLIFSAKDFEDYQKHSYLNADIAGTGETIEELEAELDIPVGSLVHTLVFYNEHAARGEDPLFHKSEEWLTPIEGPFAALDCTVGRGAFYPMFTLGGLDTQVTGEVLNPVGRVIKGLYAAGRTTAGVPRRGEGYASGMSVGDVTFFGRLAGKTAAQSGDAS
ncbi:MAG: 3-oxo-5alpha-steroid 4-dehydrogenase [Halieaceae bacterium]|jgi:3-oxo-5alpha-steroid 4-dehydrogenase